MRVIGAWLLLSYILVQGSIEERVTAIEARVAFIEDFLQQQSVETIAYHAITTKEKIRAMKHDYAIHNATRVGELGYLKNLEAQLDFSASRAIKIAISRSVACSLLVYNWSAAAVGQKSSEFASKFQDGLSLCAIIDKQTTPRKYCCRTINESDNWIDNRIDLHISHLQTMISYKKNQLRAANSEELHELLRLGIDMSCYQNIQDDIF